MNSSHLNQHFEYIPEDIHTLAEIAKTLEPPAVFTTLSGTESYSIRQGNIHLVTVADQDAATNASIALALELQKQTSVSLLSFAGNAYAIPAGMRAMTGSGELSGTLVHRFEKFSFYEGGRDLAFNDHVRTQGPGVIIINMIDWAVQTDRHRIRFAAELGRLADRYGCAIVCFTLESAERIRRARELGRGWLGMLTRLAQKTLAYAEPREDSATSLPIPLKDNELPGACKFPDEPLDSRPARERFRVPQYYCEPRTPLEKIPFEQVTHIPIEQKFPESDWYRPWAVESTWISTIVRELEFKKKHGLLRLDPDKLQAYHTDYPNFYAKFKELYSAATGEDEIVSM